MLLRFIKFSFVGSLGFLIHISILYISKTYLFDSGMESIYNIDISLNVSLALAIIIATTSNFLINSYWTWGHTGNTINIKSYIKYIKIISLSVLMQIIITNLLVVLGLNYLLANIISVIAGAAVSFILNDRLNFR
jgi:putative flippase GtrA